MEAVLTKLFAQLRGTKGRPMEGGSTSPPPPISAAARNRTR